MRQQEGLARQQQLFGALGDMVARQDAKAERERQLLAAQAKEQEANMLRPDVISTIPPEQRTSRQQFIMDEYESKARARQAGTVDVVTDPSGNIVAVDKLTGQPVGGATQQSGGLYQGLGQMLPPPTAQAPVAESPVARAEREKAQAKADVEFSSEQRKFEEMKRRERPSMERAFEVAKQKTGDVEDTIDRAIEKSGRLNTGPIGGKNPFATDMAGLLDTIQADAAFGELQRMREASKTGGALGAVSERELALLGSAQQALQQTQSEEQLDENLRKYKAVRKRALDNTARAFKDDYGVWPEGYKPSKGAESSGSGTMDTGWNETKARRLQELRAKRARGEL
jgi:hypothetical protein